MSRPYDLVVIGTGTVGGTVAHGVRKAGWSVAVIDSAPFGGTCALRGCMPKKILYGAAELADWSTRMSGKGFRDSGSIDWPGLMAFKRSFTGPVPEQREAGYRKAGIDAYKGAARFVGETAVEVGGTVLVADRIVIGTGAQPTPLEIPGEEYLVTSDAFLELEALPPRIAFVGGGYISFELANIAARAGADATILHRDATPLGHFEPELVKKLVDASRAAGVAVTLDAPVTAVRSVAGESSAGLEVDAGETTLSADLVVHGAGRVPMIDALDLEAGGVAYDPAKGVEVTPSLRSVSNPSVYAGGDAANHGWPLTPVANMHGQAIVASLTGDTDVPAEPQTVASVVFTLPPLATVGLTERQALESERRVRIIEGDTGDWFDSFYVGIDVGGYKIILDDETDLILGAHLLGHRADDIINVFALAIRHGLTREDVCSPAYGYPTSTYGVRYMLEGESRVQG